MEKQFQFVITVKGLELTIEDSLRLHRWLSETLQREQRHYQKYLTEVTVQRLVSWVGENEPV